MKSSSGVIELSTGQGLAHGPLPVISWSRVNVDQLDEPIGVVSAGCFVAGTARCTHFQHFFAKMCKLLNTMAHSRR